MLTISVKVCRAILMIGLLTLTASRPHAQALNDARIMQVLAPSTNVAPYQPFAISVIFDRDVCVPQSAIIAGARVESGRLTISLANLPSQGTDCATSKQIQWPGLPAGNFSITVGVGRTSQIGTITNDGGTTNVLATSATGSISVVAATTISSIPIYLDTPTDTRFAYSWRLSVRTINRDGNGWGPPVNISDTTDIAPMPAFAAWSPASTASTVTDLYELSYLLPGTNSAYRYFYTTNATERDQLVSTGFTYVGMPFKVVAAVGGACATALRPIYRLYQPTLNVHKFVGADTHAILAASGWISEKISFCAAPDIDRATAWQPN